MSRVSRAWTADDVREVRSIYDRIALATWEQLPALMLRADRMEGRFARHRRARERVDASPRRAR